MWFSTIREWWDDLFGSAATIGPELTRAATSSAPSSSTDAPHAASSSEPVRADVAPGYDAWPGARPEVDGLPANTILAVPGLEKWSAADRRAVLDAARELGTPVDSLVSVWASESGLNPEAAFGIRHTDDGHVMRDGQGAPMLDAGNVARVQAGKKPFFAVGILQLTTQAHLEGFGDNEALIQALSWTPAEQIERIAVPLYRKMPSTRGATPGHLYMLNFLPQFAGKGPDFVLGDATGATASKAIYDMNKGFDAGSKGLITVGDVWRAVGRQVKRAGFRRMTVDGTVLAPAGAPPSSSAATSSAPAASSPGASAPPAPKASSSPAKAASSPAGSRLPWERFGAALYDLVPLVVNGHTVHVCRVPVYATASGITVYPPFSVRDAKAYFDQGAPLALPTAAILDQMHMQGWFHAPITGFYDYAKSMDTEDLVLELGRRWGLAMTNGGYRADSGLCVVNIAKAWIFSKKGIENPGQAVNRGYYSKKGELGKDSPIQREGIAHPVTYRDLGQAGWFVSTDADYLAKVEQGAFGDPPLDVAAFWRATGL